MIANIANISFSRGEFSPMMKSGLVSPLLKKPGLDPSDLKNFRPIISLSTISKLLERLALEKLKSQIISSPNYCNLQSAYRSEHSTETALVKVMDDIYRAVDSGSAFTIVGLDISAAFDAINHRILPERLEVEFGISRPPIQWIAGWGDGVGV